MDFHEHNRDAELARREGQTPFRLEIKFTPEEWREFGRLANEANTSRYNFIKSRLLDDTSCGFFDDGGMTGCRRRLIKNGTA